MNVKTPYANLNPDLILSAIETTGVRCNGSLIALNSYENRVYQVGVEDSKPLIAKFYRPLRWSNEAILEEHQFALELIQHEIPIVAPLILNQQTLHLVEDFRFALFSREGGRTLELDNLAHLTWMGRFIGRLHAVGKSKPFKHRLQLSVDQYGYIPYQFLRDNQFIPANIEKNYALVMQDLLEKITQTFQKIGSTEYLRLHGDCHVGNILWQEGPKIVDLDDCLMGPAIQDLWMLISGDTDAEKRLQLDAILTGYEEFCDFDYRELKLIEALRTLRMIHYSGWLAKRWDDPAFPLTFPWFNTQAYWEEQIAHLRDQAMLLEEGLTNDG